MYKRKMGHNCRITPGDFFMGNWSTYMGNFVGFPQFLWLNC